MKKILFVVIPFLLVHCTSPESKIRSSFERHFKETGNDPDSYEFVKLESLEEITYEDVISFGSKNYTDKLHPGLFKDAEKEYSEKKYDPVAYSGFITFRANNALGAKILKKYYILVSVESGYKVIAQQEGYINIRDYMSSFQPLRGLLEKI